MSETKTVWHKFVQEPPPQNNCRYLVTLECLKAIFVQPYEALVDTDTEVRILRWKDGSWENLDFGVRVIAWAELPEPYQTE